MTDAKFKDLIDGYTTSMSTLITSETQNIKDSIKELKEQVSIQNGSVRELKEWKASCVAINIEREKGLGHTFTIIALVITFLIGTGSLIMSSSTRNKQYEDKAFIEWQLSMKQSKDMGAATRSIHPDSINIDLVKYKK